MELYACDLLGDQLTDFCHKDAFSAAQFVNRIGLAEKQDIIEYSGIDAFKKARKYGYISLKYTLDVPGMGR